MGSCTAWFWRTEYLRNRKMKYFHVIWCVAMTAWLKLQCNMYMQTLMWSLILLDNRPIFRDRECTVDPRNTKQHVVRAYLWSLNIWNTWNGLPHFHFLSFVILSIVVVHCWVFFFFSSVKIGCLIYMVHARMCTSFAVLLHTRCNKDLLLPSKLYSSSWCLYAFSRGHAINTSCCFFNWICLDSFFFVAWSENSTE